MSNYVGTSGEDAARLLSLGWFTALELGDGRFRLVGELDGVAVASVRERLVSLSGDVEFDCSKVTFIDSSGLHLLVAIRDACTAGGGGSGAREPVSVRGPVGGLDRSRRRVGESRRRSSQSMTDAGGRVGGVGRSIRSGRSPACSESRRRHCGRGRSATASWSRPAAKVAQRIYSRDELEQLRFVVDEVEAGSTAGRRPPAVGRASAAAPDSSEPSRSPTASRSWSCSPNAIGTRRSCSSTSCGPRATTSAWRSTRSLAEQLFADRNQTCRSSS